MKKASRRRTGQIREKSAGNELFSSFIRAVVRGKTDQVSRMLAKDPRLATAQCAAGATRQTAGEFFFEEIAHYMYRGDTALHMAAAAFQRPAAELLVSKGANCRARNRRGAEPLHYAADANRWEPAAQKETIKYLLAAGADPNALDKSGVSPLHRAVRTRASEAVRALLAGGADVRSRNRSGSTPLHLAVQDTGRGGAGAARARSEQEKIIVILLEAGARATDRDGKGKSVVEASSNEDIRRLLANRVDCA
jgi:Ankyrin repeats (many copies)